MASRSSFESANRRARRLEASVPQAVSARYDRKSGRVVIGLSSNVEVAFSPHDAQGLESARPSQLEEIEISPSGFGIHFPRLDADFYLPAILEGFLGSRKWTASRLGQAGGQLGESGGPHETLPEYDFSRARPNKYAARYSSHGKASEPQVKLQENDPLDAAAIFTLGFSDEKTRRALIAEMGDITGVR